MPRHDVFRRFGFYTVEKFLDRGCCASLRAAADASRLQQSTIQAGNETERIDERYRRSMSAPISPQVRSLIEENLSPVRPELENHFGVPLRPQPETGLLVYSVGDFFRYHRDDNEPADGPQRPYSRSVSTVIFLNDEETKPKEGCFCGGSLTFYELMKFPQSERYGLGLIGEEGLLVAFPASTPHCVTALTFGQRFTAVSWFMSNKAARLSYRPADAGADPIRGTG